MNLYISPAQLTLNNGPRFSATLIKGLATTFTAYILDSSGTVSAASQVDWQLNWGWIEEIPSIGDANDFLSPGNQIGQVLVTPPVSAMAGQVMTLQATYNGQTSTVKITIEGSDLLIYAPDQTRYLYHVHTKTWLANPNTVLLPLVQPLVVNDVPVANLQRTQNGLCFLNLNSILPTKTEPSSNQQPSVSYPVRPSDLLIYAPDGNVYQVHAATWRDPQNEILVNKCPESVQAMLASQVPVANIPQPSLSTTAGAPSDNITCFLLNLNSILLNPGK